ncbi:hypothetical protein CR513_16773, partial [Mucuna pruriens]
MPKSTMDRLPYDRAHIKTNYTCESFQRIKGRSHGRNQNPLMNIRPTYNCLLGRPWIHLASIVPSSLHQKLKFMVGDKLVIIFDEGHASKQPHIGQIYRSNKRGSRNLFLVTRSH